MEQHEKEMLTAAAEYSRLVLQHSQQKASWCQVLWAQDRLLNAALAWGESE